MHRGAFLLVALSLVAAGCVGVEDADGGLDKSSLEVPRGDLVELNLSVEPSLGFTSAVVDVARGYAADLYEPTIEVSDTGVIYVTGHTILVDTTGAPVFMSKDDGKTWEQLPFFENLQMPAGIHGATPPPSDEIFLTAGEEGWLYGVDITGATFPVNAWEGDGQRHAYHNPNAYDRVDSTTSGTCGAVTLNDRPWGVAANGKLLMVSNPGTGTVQIGVMNVPPDDQVDEPGNPLTGPTWNMCAGRTSYIPGIPDMREDHLFAVPYQADDQLKLAMGNANNVMHVEHETVFNFTNTGGGTSNYGQVVFDAEGTMFVGIRNNTEKLADGERRGQLKLAVSTDGGESFDVRTFRVDAPTTSLYMDGNMNGPGALLTWAQQGDSGTDWYAAHLFVGADGGPVVQNVTLALDEGPAPSAHVQGAAVGPDGRSHLVMYHGDYLPTDRALPLEVLVQESGATLPVTG